MRRAGPPTWRCSTRQDHLLLRARRKHWITDPQGIAWEHFHAGRHSGLPRGQPASAASACCTPAYRGKPDRGSP